MPKNLEIISPTAITAQFLNIYHTAGIPDDILESLRKELALPSVNRLSKFARPRRIEMLTEAINFPKGKSQETRAITPLYKDGVFIVAVGKPGKEAAPDFKRKHYKTGVAMNNTNDMNPFVIQNGKRREGDLTFLQITKQSLNSIIFRSPETV